MLNLPINRRRAQDDSGFTLVIAMALMLISSLLVAGALASASGDVRLVQANTSGQRAYLAAQAGIQIFEYNLNKNVEYWEECPKTAKAISIPGEANATYSYETLPSTGYKECEKKVQASIIEAKTKSANGTFRVKVTGEAEHVSRSIVATFDHPGFLNFVFLSNYEVEDPATFATPPENCRHYYKERLEHKNKKGQTWYEECPPIPFIPGDELKGPFHTNDAVALCSYLGGSPTFGRTGQTPADEIQMGESHYADTLEAGCGGTYKLAGNSKIVEKTETIEPPETDVELLKQAEAGYKLSGRTVIKLEGNKMTVTNNKKEKSEKSFPPNGIVYVENQASPVCEMTYSPFSFDKDYEKDSACGDVYVEGTFTESITIASAKDVIITGNLTTTGGTKGEKPTGNAILGLIAQDFVRVYHPVSEVGVNERNSCPSAQDQTAAANSVTKELGGVKENLVIDAAILSTANSFIVDNFACGAQLGKLTVWGAIAQEFRGRVTDGLKGGGYPEKNYNYDERMKYAQPPNFLAPTSTGDWVDERETAPSESYKAR